MKNTPSFAPTRIQISTPALRKSTVLDCLKIALGSTLTAAAFGLFTLPLNFAAGGVTGLGKLLHQVTSLPVYQLVLGLNCTLFVIGFLFLGAAFITKTLFATFYFPMALQFFQVISPFNQHTPYPLAWAVVTGIVLGIGGGLIIRGHGSGGGYDIIGIILNRYFPISIALVVNAIDAVLILIQAAQAPLLRTAGGLIVILVCTVVMHLVIEGIPEKNPSRSHP